MLNKGGVEGVGSDESDDMKPAVGFECKVPRQYDKCRKSFSEDDSSPLGSREGL